MKRHRLRRYVLVAAGLALLPPVLWIGVVLLSPTPWARGLVVAALERSSKRSVALSGFAVRFSGAIELAGLSFGSPQSTDDPWLKTENVQLDVSLCRLLSGRFDRCSIEVEGTTLRVLRRADGSLELADFILPPPRPTDLRQREDNGPERIAIAFRDATVTVIDEPSRSLLHLAKVEGDAACEGRRIVVNNMRGASTAGPFNSPGSSIARTRKWRWKRRSRRKGWSSMTACGCCGTPFRYSRAPRWT